MKRFVVLLLISFFAFSGSYASAYAQENATDQTSVFPTPDQIDELFKQIYSGRISKQKLQGFLQTDSATNNQGVARDNNEIVASDSDIKELLKQIESGRITKQKLQGFLQTDQGVARDNNEVVARDIMGDDIIFPDEVTKARGLSYTEAQLKQLSDTMPTAEVLRWGKGNGYALMPTPPKAMSLLDVRSLKVDDFHRIESYYRYDREPFARNDKTTFGWLMIRKTPVDNSMGKNWDEQNKLLTEVERVPNAAELSWFITTLFEVRRVKLLIFLASTSSLGSDGYRVIVGDLDGLMVSGGRWRSRNDEIGLASARKLP